MSAHQSRNNEAERLGFLSAIPERGCVVLDQPQRVAMFTSASAGLQHSRAPGRNGKRTCSWRCVHAVLLLMFVLGNGSFAADTTNSTGPFQIDLATALRLAGAQNLDVRIAREKLAEAKANHGSAMAQFFPWIAPGITYRRHDDYIQDVSGNVIEVHKQSYAPGAAINAQVDLGDAYYKQLAAKQLFRAADHALEAQRQESTATAAQNYFDLLAANAAIGVTAEAVNISSNYEAEVERAVGAGIAFKGEQLRVRVQTERNQITLRRAVEERRIAATKLAQTLHLDPAVDLLPRESELVPVTLASTNASTLMQDALMTRAELKQSGALIASAREAKKGATYAPLVPSVGAQAFFGGLGGGRDDGRDNFGPQEDYALGLSWRIGPGGLLDFDRQRAARARLQTAELTGEKLREQIVREVIEANTRSESLSEQLATARRAIAAAEESLRLAQQRKEFGVGIVLETIQAEQELTRTRLDYLRSIADFNKAQYGLLRATGRL
jgi:outer membrane protein TolC